MNILSFLLCVGVLALAVWLICNTKKEDMGCDFDCKHCPFPPCSKEEIERMRDKINEFRK